MKTKQNQKTKQNKPNSIWARTTVPRKKFDRRGVVNPDPHHSSTKEVGQTWCLCGESVCCVIFIMKKYKQKDQKKTKQNQKTKQTKQTNQPNKQTNKQTKKQTDRQIDRQTDSLSRDLPPDQSFGRNHTRPQQTWGRPRDPFFSIYNLLYAC